MNSLHEFILRFAASGMLPASLFFKQPNKSEMLKKEGLLHLEIVSHCWNYSHLLVYQLRSLVDFPPKKLKVTMTVYYAKEDYGTTQLLGHFSKINLPYIKWNFQHLEVPKLMRRAIGRNIAAKSTVADWIWFTDCDVLFFDEALDSLAEALQGRQQILVYPHTLLATTLLAASDPMLVAAGQHKIDRKVFSPRYFTKATGPIQIMHGDAAREFGYCDQLLAYQSPQKNWVKTYEDRAFRWLLGTKGTPINVPNLYWIRHQEKGRYHASNLSGKFRKLIRKIKSHYFNR